MKILSKVKQAVPIVIFLFVLTGCISTPKVQQNNLMVGMYSYMADRAVFKECSTGDTYPVTFEGDNINVEKAYLKTVKTAGQSMMLYIKGKIVQRKKVDSTDIVPKLFVEKFIQFSPKEQCQNSIKNVSLINTHWKLIELNNKRIIIAKTAREAFMILKDGKIYGNSGCNGFGGRYKLDANKLSFSDKGMMSTRMFCKNSVEREFLIAMKNMDNFSINIDVLSVFDKKQVLLAKFKMK